MFKLLGNRLVLFVSFVFLGLCVSCSSSNSPKEASPDVGRPGPPVSEVIFSGNVAGMETVPGKGDTIAEIKQGNVFAVALSSRGMKREPDGDGDSGIVRLTPDLSSALSGRKITVSVTLRRAPLNGSPTAKAMYSRPGVATSGWKELQAGSEFAVESFDYVVPTAPGPRGPDLVSIWADPDSQGRAIEVRSVEIRAVGQ